MPGKCPPWSVVITSQIKTSLAWPDPFPCAPSLAQFTGFKLFDT